MPRHTGPSRAENAGAARRRNRKTAAQVCLSRPEDELYGHGPLCEDCTGAHGERPGPEFFPPAINSPRTRVCGRTGPTDSPDPRDQQDTEEAPAK